MKRGRKVIIFLGLLILLIIPLTSAGVFSDLFGKITGFDTQGTPTLNVTIGNSIPTIDFVEAIQSQNVTESDATSVTFNFTATDTDGGSTINVSTAQGRFQKGGEATRANTSCVNFGPVGNDVKFTCTVKFYYFDAAATDWIINVTVKDNNDAKGENSTTNIQFNLFTAMVISPTSLGWEEFGIAQTNQESSSNPLVLNNTGNDQSLNINVTGFNLRGETTPTQFIFAANLTVNNVAADCAGGTQMSNATSLNVTSTILQRGNNSLNNNNATSGQEETFFCVTAVNSDLSAQSYSSSAYNSGTWNIDIIT